MNDREIREALNRHWAASNAGDFATEHADPFEARESRKQWVTSMDATKDQGAPEGALGRTGG